MSDGISNAPDPGTIGRLATQRSKYKQLSVAAARERDEARQQLAELNKQIEELKKGDQSGRIQELQTELRTLRHRRAFDKLAKERGASDDVLDDLFDIIKYKPDGDEPDEKALAKLLDDAAAHPARSRFFAEWDGDDDADIEPDREPPAREIDRRPSPDAGRGGRHNGSGTQFVTRAQLADPKFALDPKNQELLRTAKVRG